MDDLIKSSSIPIPIWIITGFILFILLWVTTKRFKGRKREED